MEIPKSVLKLVETFDLHRDAYLSPSYNETQVRRQFIDPMFEALGWDVQNTSGYAEQYKQVVHEDSLNVGGSAKAPDYSFRLGGRRMFFLEAKKPSVNLKDDPAPAYQLRRYAWTAKLPVSILTDFEEFIVYDTRVKPEQDDKASKARILHIPCAEYPERWNEIASLFSPEAIQKGALDKYVQSTSKKRGTAEVDDAFLAEIEEWRELLAKNIALRNSGLTQRDLNFAVQITIDRIVFLRICEDRRIEMYAQLMALLNGDHIYDRLRVLFERADERYNSGLFHFHKEKDRNATPDTLTPKLTIDDKVLKTIIRRLYYPDCPYEFSVLPAEILGQVYERFLGSVIRLTSGHQAKIEQKPEVRKAGGVYYTPSYIVDYIVKNTVGKLLEGKTPQQIGGLTDKWKPSKTARPLAVLDPACGSGSFLLGAYQFLLDWHLEQYIKEPEVHGKGKEPRIYEHHRGGWRLTTSERKRILLANIYGVDIDSQAVEVTKLSLLLKVLEGVDAEVLQRQLSLFHERALPDLDNNIKCGNSLIGPDFYKGKQGTFDEEEEYRINAFDWNAEFSAIMKSGGFDAVIGNPPYVDIKGMPSSDVDYIFHSFKFANNRINLFATFIENGFGLCHKGIFAFSMIVPTALLAQDSYKALRTWITSSYGIVSLVRLPNESFGVRAGDVKVDTVVFVFGPQTLSGKETEIIGYSGYDRITRIDSEQAFLHGRIDQDIWKQNSDCIWSLNVLSTVESLLRKCESVGQPMERFAKFCLGITPYDKHKGHSEAQIKSKVFHADRQKDKTFRKLLAGNDVSRYAVQWNGQTWISYGPWLGACRDRSFFTEPRILVKQIIDWTDKRIWAALTDEELYNSQNAFNLLQTSDVSLEYLLGILNSKLITYYHRKRYLEEFKMRFQKVLIKDCKRIPVRGIQFTDSKERARHDKMVFLVQRELDLHKRLQTAKTDHDRNVLQRQIDATDTEIDHLVYDLYGLGKDEIEIVEKSIE